MLEMRKTFFVLLALIATPFAQPFAQETEGAQKLEYSFSDEEKKDIILSHGKEPEYLPALFMGFHQISKKYADMAPAIEAKHAMECQIVGTMSVESMKSSGNWNGKDARHLMPYIFIWRNVYKLNSPNSFDEVKIQRDIRMSYAVNPLDSEEKNIRKAEKLIEKYYLCSDEMENFMSTDVREK